MATKQSNINDIAVDLDIGGTFTDFCVFNEENCGMLLLVDEACTRKETVFSVTSKNPASGRSRFVITLAATVLNPVALVYSEDMLLLSSSLALLVALIL